ncbi:MAG: putative lipid kinase [Acidimicrobiia bacterium]|nr:putative lipid kinase [Acidimicrobiia bacterium]
MRILLIVNPFASSVTARNRVVIQKALAADHDLEVAETHRRGHATRLAQDAAKRGLDVVAVLAGDGTLNEAANGLVGSSTALAALPGGSTNVFARTIGLPNDPVDATERLVQWLAAPADDGQHPALRHIGLGSVNGRCFLFHTGIGFDAAVVREVERRDVLKRWAGHPLFVYATLATWFRRYRRKPPRFSVTLEDGTVVPDAVFAVCLNTNPYTFLGNRPVDLSPGAGLEQPLAVVIFRDLRISTLLPSLTSAIRGRGVRASKRVIDQRNQQTVIVTAEPVVPYQVDGDDLGDAARLEFRWSSHALWLVVPPDQ